jgi:hypothetical protein
MHYFFSILTLILINGCADSPTPRSDKEAKAQQMIQTNITEAEKARSEYLALQEKRKKES